MPDIAEVPLASLTPGQSAVVYRVTSHNPALLAHLRDLRLVPGVRVELREVAPFDGPLTVRVDDVERSIGRAVAQSVHLHRSTVEPN